jgi:xanthine dehydrogenase FAD-binding subunit
MQLWSDYVIADTLAQALHALAASPGLAHPIAGGSDLLLDLQQGVRPPIHTLVDITQIPELNCLELRGDTLFIGAALPVSQITRSQLVCEHAASVVEACRLIGGPQVRNTATLGGNVAHALPAADGMIALLAMDAQAEIASLQGRRMEPILHLFKGPGETALQLDREILVGFHIPARLPGQASAFGRVMRPQGVALPILNMAIWLDRAGDCIRDIRIAVGPAGPVPQRARLLEQSLIDSTYNPSTVARTAALIEASLNFRTSPQRASKAYRYHLCEVLLEDVIGVAWKRAERNDVPWNKK